MLRTRHLVPALALTLATALTGCDTVAEQLGIDSLPIPLGSVAKNIPLITTSTIVVGGQQSIERPGPELPNLVRVTSIVLNPADVTYTPNSNQSSNSGTLNVALIVGGYVAGMTTVTISGGSVTAVSPTTLAVGTYDGPTFEQIKGACAAPACTLPTLAADYATATPAVAQQKVGAAMRSPSFTFGTLVRATGNLNGTLSMSKMTLKLSYGS